MPVVLNIPDSVVGALKMPPARAERDLRLELAVSLYAHEILPFGKARELAGVTKHEFACALAALGVSRHYDASDLADDVAYASGQ